MTQFKTTVIAALLAVAASAAFAGSGATGQKERQPVQPSAMEQAANANQATADAAITSKAGAKARKHAGKHHRNHMAHAKHKHPHKSKPQEDKG